MNAAELRPGNFVYGADNEAPIIVTSEIIALIERHPGIAEPIEITEHRLTLFGFNKEEYKDGYIGIDAKHANFVLLTPENQTYPGKYRWRFYENGKPRIIEVDFIHQLQNLFFVFTKEELIFKGELHEFNA